MANTYNYRLKIYPNGASEYVKFKKQQTVQNNKPKNDTSEPHKINQLLLTDIPYLPTRQDDLTEIQKLSRRVTKVRDYVLSGNFTMFGTLTFAPEHASDDLDAVLRKKMILFTRMLRRRGTRYYIVAETHASGIIHLHGLFSTNLPTAPSPASRKYMTIPIWEYGFSSVSQIRDRVATAYYVTKYVTKESIDGRSVWVSQGLLRPQVLYNTPDLLTPIVSQWENDNIIKTIRSI